MNTEKVTKLNTKTSIEYWVNRISDSYDKSLEAIFNIGEDLIMAKEELKHGDYTKMIKAELPFSARTAQKYVKIFKALKAKDSSFLPKSLDALYLLATLDNKTWKKAKAEKLIHPDMTIEDTRRLTKKQKTEQPTEMYYWEKAFSAVGNLTNQQKIEMIKHLENLTEIEALYAKGEAYKSAFDTSDEVLGELSAYIRTDKNLKKKLIRTVQSYYHTDSGNSDKETSQTINQIADKMKSKL